MNLLALQIPANDAAIFAALPADEKVRVRTLLKLFEQAARSASERRSTATGGVPAVVITAPQEVAVAWG